ncbi:dihydrodipicolinate synthase family protein [Phytoactinopolyspora limicola]|uniref:dihydrodipicolinate synthase family protein n=1 Tax=Phytoactinopolyspora limicola TaxID=2715536 RepID=UPI00140A2FEF|nr:dihydrodipicolinate synthase family protein [Phytoactinopolyspora limicola]
MLHHALPIGIVTPLVAMTSTDGKPDEDAVRALIDRQVAGGVRAVLVNGSMGELGNLTVEQRITMTETVVRAVAGRLPVWAGAAGLGTAETVENAMGSTAVGADAILALQPLFFDLSDSELERHFTAVASAIDVPLLAYDVPQRTPRKLPVQLTAKMARDGIIQGVKDSSGDLTAARELTLATDDISHFARYMGTEIAIDAAVTLGFHGSVPGLANILPAVGAAIDSAAREGDFSAAAQSQGIYAALLKLLNIPLAGAGGISVAAGAFKAAVNHVLGRAHSPAMPPLTQPDAEFLNSIAAVVDPLLTSPDG